MAIHTIKIRINEHHALAGLTEAMAEQISEEINEDVYSIKGMRAQIKADAKALYPRYLKAMLSEMAGRADDAIGDITDDLLGWSGNWAPLNKVVGKYSNDSVLADEVEDMQRDLRVERVKAEAAELGLTVTED